MQISAKRVTDPQNLKKFEDAQAGLPGARSDAPPGGGRELPAAEGEREPSATCRSQLEGTENRIAVARNRYIQSVQEFNNLVTVPPTSFTTRS